MFSDVICSNIVTRAYACVDLCFDVYLTRHLTVISTGLAIAFQYKKKK